jgi:hypothetical protein
MNFCDAKMSRPRFRMGALVALPALCLFAWSAPEARATGEWFDLRAESYVASHDAGTPTIHKVNCPSFEDGQAVDGMNLQGEWIELAVAFPEEYCFVDSVGGQQAGQIARFAIRFRQEGEDVAADTVETSVGGIMGCKASDWVVSHRPICLEPGDYRVRIELLTYGIVRVDGLHLRAAPLPVLEPSWGRIKSIYLGS